jgi:hypothetical protein
MTAGDDILSDTFHFCALRAYLEIWAVTRQFPPDSEATRRRTYELYEAALAEKNRQKQSRDISRYLPREAGPGCEAPEGGGEPHPCEDGQSDLHPKSSGRNCLDDAREVAK